MKTILFFMFCCLCLWFCSASGKKRNKGIEKISLAQVDTINYQTQIQPILQEKCSPCHFNGGKMYQRMPFDNGETIVDHQAGILKRIKDEEKAALIRQYVRQRMK
jgi:hypothetical protein